VRSKELHGQKSKEEKQIEIPANDEAIQPVTKKEFQTSKTDLLVEMAQLVIDVVRVGQRFARLYRRFLGSEF